MTALVDTSVLVKYSGAKRARGGAVRKGALGGAPHASDITAWRSSQARGREKKRGSASSLDPYLASRRRRGRREAGALGSEWLASHGAIDGADLATAASPSVPVRALFDAESPPLSEVGGPPPAGPT